MLWDVYAGIADIPGQSNSYWIAPTGEVSVSDMRHINDVIANPESFGIDEALVKKLYKKYHEKLYQEGEAREAIITILMQKGWIRLRNVTSGRSGQGWIVQCWQLNASVKDNVWSWAVAMLKSKYASKYQEIFLHAVSDNEEVRGTFDEFAKGKALYASERGQDSDYDKDRQQYFKNEPDETPGLNPLDFKQIWQTDNYQIPVDVDKKPKEQVDFEGRENLQLWANQEFKDEIFLALMLPEAARKKYEHIGGLDDDLHMTLLFVKEKPTDEQKEKILKAVAKVAKEFKPFKCELTGVATFDNETQTMAALVNVLEGAELHTKLLAAVEGAYHSLDDRDYGYLPHVTLKMQGPHNVSLDKLEPYEWTAKELMLKFSDDEAYDIALGSGDIAERLEATAAPETYTDGSDIKQDKQQFDERALEMRQEDHLDINNQRDWPFQDPDFKNLRLIPIKLDDQAQNKQQKPQLARSSLKLTWEVGVGYDHGDKVLFYDQNGRLDAGYIEAMDPEKKEVPVLIRHEQYDGGYAEWIPASAIVSLAVLDEEVDFGGEDVIMDPHRVLLLSEWGGKPFVYFGSSGNLLVGHSGEIHEDLASRMLKLFDTYPGVTDSPSHDDQSIASRIISEEGAYYGRLTDDGSLVSFWVPEQEPDYDQELADCLFELVRQRFLNKNARVNFAGDVLGKATPLRTLMARGSLSTVVAAGTGKLAWVSPEGRVFDVQDLTEAGHDMAASKIIESNPAWVSELQTSQTTARDFLLKKGWIRVNDQDISIGSTAPETKSALLEFVSSLSDDSDVTIEFYVNWQYFPVFNGTAGKFVENFDHVNFGGGYAQDSYNKTQEDQEISGEELRQAPGEKARRGPSSVQRLNPSFVVNLNRQIRQEYDTEVQQKYSFWKRGRGGLKELRAALEVPFQQWAGTDAHEDLDQKAAALMIEMVTVSPFGNHNVNTAWLSGRAFLQANGYDYKGNGFDVLDILRRVHTSELTPEAGYRLSIAFLDANIMAEEISAEDGSFWDSPGKLSSLLFGAVDLPGGETYNQYFESDDIQPDETLQHGPTTRREKWDPVKYRYNQTNEETFFEKGVHGPVRKEMERDIMPFGSLKLSWEQDTVVRSGEDIIKNGERGDVYQVNFSDVPSKYYFVIDDKSIGMVGGYFGGTVREAFDHLTKHKTHHYGTLSSDQPDLQTLSFTYVTHVNSDDFNFYLSLARSGALFGTHPRTGFVVYAQEEPEILYPTYEDIVDTNRKVIAQHGGIHATYAHTQSAVEAAIGRPQAGFAGYSKYPSLPEKSAALAHALATHHAFPDGNKRTAYETAVNFMHGNGYDLKDAGAGLVDLILKISVGEDKGREERDVEEQELIQYFMSNAIPYVLPEEDYEDEP